MSEKEKTVDVFLPWKEMDASYQIKCPCGEYICIEQKDFAYNAVCLKCERLFQMAYTIKAVVHDNLKTKEDYKDFGAIVWDEEQEERLLLDNTSDILDKIKGI